MANNDTPWAERWPEPEFDQQGWEEVMSELFESGFIVLKRKKGEFTMNRIKELRKQKNLSLKQLSSKLKESGEYLSADSLSKYERDVRNPKIENLEKLARYYEVTVDYLRGKSNKKHGSSVADTAISEYGDVVALVKKWGAQRGITKPDNAKTQTVKLMEEVGELSEGINKISGNSKYLDQIKDSVGDIQVVLIILCKQLGVDYEQCLYDAYDVIKDRQGKTTADGSFVKQEDLDK